MTHFILKLARRISATFGFQKDGINWRTRWRSTDIVFKPTTAKTFFELQQRIVQYNQIQGDARFSVSHSVVVYMIRRNTAASFSQTWVVVVSEWYMANSNNDMDNDRKWKKLTMKTAVKSYECPKSLKVLYVE